MKFTIVDPTGRIVACELDTTTLEIYVYSPTFGSGDGPIGAKISPNVTISALMNLIKSI